MEGPTFAADPVVKPMFLVLLAAAAGLSCAPDATDTYELAPANVTFWEETKRLYTPPDDDSGHLRFRFCDLKTPELSCPFLSACSYPPDKLKKEIAKVTKSKSLRQELDDMLYESFPSHEKSVNFVNELCRILPIVRREKKCQPKKPCEQTAPPRGQ